MSLYSATPDYMVEISSGHSAMPSMHYHNSYELYYLQVGNRDYFIEDKLFSVSAGDFVLIPPGKMHRTGGEYGERILVGFTMEFLEKVYTKEVCQQLLTCFDYWKHVPSPAQQETCTHLLTRLLDCTDDTEAALLLGILLLELQNAQQEELQEDYVSMIVSFINKNYATIDSISDIAQQFFISKYHLCRIFKNAMKMTVIDYLNQIRVKNACQMLTFSKRTIGEISEACGYHSTAYFSSVFKISAGCSPSEYRQQHHSLSLSETQPGKKSNIS